MLSFQKKSIGLDITDEAVEAVKLKKIGRRIIIFSQGRLELEPDVVSKGRIRDKEKLSKAIKKVFSQAKPEPITEKKIIFGLPQNQTYIHIFSFKEKDKDKGVESLIEKEIEKNIPLSISDLIYSYKLTEREKGIIEVLLTIVSKKAVSEWRQFFNQMGIEANIFEVRTLADYRGLFAKPLKTNICLVDIGKEFSQVSIFTKEGLIYSQLVNSGTRIINRRISKGLGISRQGAELRQRKFGLTGPKNRIYPVLVRQLLPIRREIKRSLDYLQEREQLEINEIILIGQPGRIRGLAGYLHTVLDIPVRTGYSAITQANQSIEDVLKKSKSLLYLTTIGLALRNLDKKWVFRDPAIILKRKNKNGDLANIHFVKSSANNMFENVFSSKKILMASVLIVALALLGIIFFSGRDKGTETTEGEQPEAETAQYFQNQSFDLKIPVAAQLSEYNSERIKGRIIENTVSQADNYQEAVARSRLAVERELTIGERLWLTPVNPEQTEFPMTIKWLVYSEEDTQRLFLKEIDKLNKENVDYRLDNIQKIDLEETINSFIFYLKGKVTIALNQLIEAQEPLEEELTEEEIEESPKETLTIKETETGWLNVRKGPGTNYEKVTKVYPGEEYELLEESGNWYKVKINESTQGWIFSDYALKEE